MVSYREILTKLCAVAVAIAALCGTAHAAVVICSPNSASPLEKLAARELQRYIYLRTGALPSISGRTAPSRIVLARKGQSILSNTAVPNAARALGPQEYILRTTSSKSGKIWWIIGGDDTGALYGAYRFAQKLGVRFYLHGDVVPDKRLAALPDVNENGKPIFALRGIQPFHDFPEGPDWWSTDDYLAYISQLPKMRMNFIGLHCYPEGIAEPSVWIGTSSDVESDGRVRFSYPSRWANTALNGAWGYASMPTGEYCCGASLLFPRDQYGSDTANGLFPAPQTPEQSNSAFNNAAGMFRTAFSYAQALGVKTCVGTETPLIIPGPVRERLKQQGKDPADPKVVREVYEGIFTRIVRAYPVDYYWLWTPEGWTWGGNNEEQTTATIGDIQSALAALDSIGNPFTLATCGWVLGPVQNRAALDSVLPRQCPMSCINRSTGHAPVEPSFANIKGRQKWAIPWMENDPALTAPQPWVGRMRYDAADAKRLGCTGLLGIHWRTKMMSQNVAALAAAGWDQSYVPTSFATEAPTRDRRVGPLGGQIVTYQNPVTGTDEDLVYQSVRYNVDGYRLVVPNGTYSVTLKFNEPHYGEVGRRAFGVKLQGKQVIDHLDIFARVGQNNALDFTYPDTRVDDGFVAINFVRIVEFPCIAGIVIQGITDSGQQYERKINCGGPAYRDYEADTSIPIDHSDRGSMPVESFYIDFARANFGEDVAVAAGKILAAIDGCNLHVPVSWLDGPGGCTPNRQPWAAVKERYSFVNKLAALRQHVHAPGDLERFDYWLNTYRYMSTLAELGCLRGQLDIAAEVIAAEKDPAKRKSLASAALDLRLQLSRLWEQAIRLQLCAVDTPGEMGTIDNLERHSRKQLQFLTKHDDLLIKALGAPLPKSVELSKSYSGPPRIIVPTVRTQARIGEAMRVKAIILANERPSTAALYWRPLGGRDYRRLKLSHISRGVYEVELPAASGSFEYYIAARTSDREIVWPATAPAFNQTVVVW